MPVVELAFDRDVITDDTEGNGKNVARPAKYPKWLPYLGGKGRFIFRACVVLFLSVLTAIPFELAITAPRINRRIEQEEKVAVDKIREKAAEAESKKFDKQKDDASMQLALGNTRATKAAATDLEAYKADRKAKY